MANLNVTEIEGFEELNRKLKRLSDSVKRKEVVSILRKNAGSTVDAYKRALPLGQRSRKRTTKTRYSKRTGKKLSSADTFEYKPGNLRNSVRILTVPARFVDGNPQIVIRPSSPRGSLKTKKGATRADGYYRFMIVPRGTKLGSIRRGSRVGPNKIVREYRDRALVGFSQTVNKSIPDTAKLIQKKIDKLSS